MTTKLADQALLEKIDKLFNCGVGEHVNLPQLVVVGDQSSGKSSVLEGLTKLPFPRDKELCTRFATQITFRRSPKEGITVSILPAAHASDEHKARVSAYSKPGLKALTAKDFASIILEVQERMGVGNNESENASHVNFSEDVFKIEISGPKEEHLSIVDVPGIFRTFEAGKTTQADLDMVKHMVEGFMENPRSVMLTVVPANQDIATQEILTMAKKFDKDGIRTLGVLTKPDLVDVGAEQSVLDLVNDVRYRLTLGWQLVRNAGQKDLNDGSHDRDAAEARFFREQRPWSTLDEDKCGISSLRNRLGGLLADHIKREFPKVRTEVTDRLKLAKEKLEALGRQRGTPQEQRAYLTHIFVEFERTTSEALQATYSRGIFDRHNAMRLPTYVMNRQDDFADDMRLRGHQYAFNDVEESDFKSEATSEDESTPEISMQSVREAAEFPELDDCTIDSETEVAIHPKAGIIDWITDQHSSSRGFEVGTINPALLNTLFRGQSEKWESFALGFISDIIEKVHKFVVTLLEEVCGDEYVKQVLIAKLGDQLQERYRIALDHVKFLLEVERKHLPMTVNHYFNDNLQKARQDRLKRTAEQRSFDHYSKGQPHPDGKVVFVSSLGSADNMSNKEHVVRDFHDVLKSYYKVAMKRFVDSVAQQAALYHLIAGPKSPLKLFSAEYVSGLDDRELEEIAAEGSSLKQKRKTLSEKIQTLEEGRKLLLS